MNCPKCNKEMKVMSKLQDEILLGNRRYQEVIGRCEECDFDAIWERLYEPHLVCPKEFNARQYFFG